MNRLIAIVAATVLTTGPLVAQELPLPGPTFKAHYDPPKDYPFFRYAERVPFKPCAPASDLGNSAYLADLQLLTYLDEPIQTCALEEAGFTRVEFLVGSEARCVVADRDGATLVAFRGTTFAELREAANNLRGWKCKADTEGRVHQGYKAGLDSVWPLLKDALAKRTLPVWFTGHSLGGALATLAARRCSRTQALVTFGTPRVGDRDFAQAAAPPSVRYISGIDAVPDLVPRWLGYRHVGPASFLSSKGVQAKAPPGAWSQVWARRAGVFGILGPLSGSFVRSSAATLPGWLLDHAPYRYALLVTNALEREAVCGGLVGVKHATSR